MPTHVLIIYSTLGHFHQTSAIPRRAHELHYVQCSGINIVLSSLVLSVKTRPTKSYSRRLIEICFVNLFDVHVLFRLRINKELREINKELRNKELRENYCFSCTNAHTVDGPPVMKG